MKWVKDAKKEIMSQTIILLLKKREKLIITAQNKIEIMFKIHFSFSLIMFIKDVAKFNYSSSVDDETSMTHREIIKIIHKVNLNKTFKINEIINKTLRQLAHVIIEQIRFCKVDIASYSLTILELYMKDVKCNKLISIDCLSS